MNRFTASIAIGLAVLSGVTQAEDWPNWRGPDGRRISREVDLPTELGP